MPRTTKINLEELAVLHRTMGYKKLARHFGCQRRAVEKAVYKLGIERKDRTPKRLEIDPVDLYELYVTKELGYLRISKILGVSESGVRRHVKALQINQPSRAFRPSGKPRRARRLRSQEFLTATKRNRYLAEKGRCQECGGVIGDGSNWREATYHHIINCKDGGTRDPTNCMVLHSSCHNDPEIFLRLHGFSIDRLANYAAQPKNASSAPQG